MAEGTTTVSVRYLQLHNGGFTGRRTVYKDRPEHYDAIRHEVRESRADIFGLGDTLRWHRMFSPEDLEKDMEYPQAYMIGLDPLRSQDRVNPQSGMVLLSHENMEAEKLWIGTRHCIRAYVHLEKRRLVIYIIELSQFNEDLRMLQAKALLEDIGRHSGDPVVVMGNFNTVRPQDLPALHALGGIMRLPGIRWIPGGFTSLIRGLTEAEVLPMFADHGFVDARNSQPGIPTMHPELPFIGPLAFIGVPVDHILGRGVGFSDFQVKPNNFSNHSSISAEVHIH